MKEIEVVNKPCRIQNTADGQKQKQIFISALEQIENNSRDNDGSGVDNAIGDYASAAAAFKVTAPEDTVLALNRIIISVEDAGTFDSGAYGNGIVLTNGIKVQTYDPNTGEVCCDLTNGNEIKTNADWAAYCHDVTLHNFGAGNPLLTVRWTFGKAGAPLYIKSGREFRVVLNDDFSDLVGHKFQVQGRIINL